MEKTQNGTIFKEKDSTGSNLDTSNDATVKQKCKKSDWSRQPRINDIPSKSTSKFSPTSHKSGKNRTLSQSNTIDVWLNKSGKEEECKSVERSKERREKENSNNVGKQEECKKNKSPTISVTSRTSVKDAPSQTKTNNRSKHDSLKVINKKTYNNVNGSSRKRSETKSKSPKVDSSSHQRKLDSYLDDKYKQHKSDNKRLETTTDCPSSSRTTKKEHQQTSRSDNESAKKDCRPKSKVEKSNHENLSVISIKKKYKRIKSPVGDEKIKKPSDKKSNKVTKKDTVWSSKDEGSKHKSKTKYNELPITVSSKRSTENRNEKSRSKMDIENNKSSRKRSRSEMTKGGHIKISLKAQKKLDSYLSKSLKPDKQKFSRSDLNESCELPCFKNCTKKVKKPKKDEFVKKYGISLPTVEEILKEQRDLERYRQQLQSLEGLENKSFELPFSVKDLERSQETYEDLLDCKHLATDEITVAFKENLVHISDIFYGKKFNDRHERYFDTTKNYYSHTMKDLCYSTSMIVFNFDQKEHMLTLMKEEFDPNDKWTPYFFQVLLPELCMKIFMDTHGMTYDEAAKYLDTRPIDD